MVSFARTGSSCCLCHRCTLGAWSRAGYLLSWDCPRGRGAHGPDPSLPFPTQVSHVFTNFGKGIRYVSFEQYGRDTRSWVGHYGVLVTHSSVRVRIRLS